MPRSPSLSLAYHSPLRNPQCQLRSEFPVRGVELLSGGRLSFGFRWRPDSKNEARLPLLLLASQRRLVRGAEQQHRLSERNWAGPARGDDQVSAPTIIRV